MKDSRIDIAIKNDDYEKLLELSKNDDKKVSKILENIVKEIVEEYNEKLNKGNENE